MLKFLSERVLKLRNLRHHSRNYTQIGKVITNKSEKLNNRSRKLRLIQQVVLDQVAITEHRESSLAWKTENGSKREHSDE